MPRFHPYAITAGFILTTLSVPLAAQAQAPATAAASAPQAPAAPPATAVPPGLVGAWGSDSSCTSDVAIFRADGKVINPSAPPGTPPLFFTVSGDGITLSDGKQSGVFAFALSDQAVAWSNGSAMVLKERCADQTPFAEALKTTAAITPGSTPAIPAGPLAEQVRALAGQPLPFQGGMAQIQSVRPAPKKAPYTGVTALPDPQAIPGDARLFYRIFPTVAEAAAYVSLATDDKASFVREPRGAGFFSTASALDEGPQDSKQTPIAIACLRFHPRRLQTITVSCFAHMPDSPLVVGGEQSFPLSQTTDQRNVGPQDDLSATLSLTGSAIAQVRRLGTPAP